MFNLSQMKDTSRPYKKVQRVGRGIGSKRGATSGRGTKGDGARSGYKRRYGYEGGQVPLYRKVPVRGFTRGRFAEPEFAINLTMIDAHYQDGEVVNRASLVAKKLMPRWVTGMVKVLSMGELTKKVSIALNGYSAGAKAKLEAAQIPFTVVAL